MGTYLGLFKAFIVQFLKEGIQHIAVRKSATSCKCSSLPWRLEPFRLPTTIPGARASLSTLTIQR